MRRLHCHAALCGVLLCWFMSPVCDGQTQEAAEELRKKMEEYYASHPLALRPIFQEDPFLKADALRKAGKNEEALQAVNEALRINPNRGEAYSLRSGIEGNLQHYAEGVKDAEIAIKLSKTARQRAMAAYNKGFNLTGLDQKQAALEAYKLALRFDPSYSMAHFGRGKLFYFLGMWKESKAELDLSKRPNPTV